MKEKLEKMKKSVQHYNELAQTAENNLKQVILILNIIMLKEKVSMKIVCVSFVVEKIVYYQWLKFLGLFYHTSTTFKIIKKIP